MKKPKKKELKVEWADKTAIDALEPFVDEVLACLAEVLDLPGAKSAWVSDESSVWDFLPTKATGRTTTSKLSGRKINIVTADTEENKKLLLEVSRRLGVPCGIHDRIYEVAIRLRDK